jgi:hypothetical protein
MLALVALDAEAASKVEKDITTLQQSWAKRWQLLTHHVTRIAEAVAINGTERSTENRPPD